MATILVTGAGGPAGRSVALLLLARGHVVIGVDMQPVDLPGVRTQLVPAANDHAFVPALRRVAVENGADLVIPTVSEELPVLARTRAAFAPIPVVVGTPMAVLAAHDKFHTWVRLVTAGVPVPRTALPSRVRTTRAVALMVGWPCIAKPRIGRGGRGVALYTPADMPALRALDDRFMLQEFVSGVEYAPNIYLGLSGLRRCVTLRKTALKQGLIGNALSVVPEEAPDVAELALAAGSALGLHGPLDIDIRRRADGQPVVLEVNARFGANSARAPQVLDALLAETGIASSGDTPALVLHRALLSGEERAWTC